MPQTYFTADWHFSHPNIARYCPQFRLQSDNTNELNEYLIDCWNRVVTPQDTVYNLGDVCFAKKPAHIEAVLQRLNGQHHLIYGNHDYLIRQNEAHFLNTRKFVAVPRRMTQRGLATAARTDQQDQLAVEVADFADESFEFCDHVHLPSSVIPDVCSAR